MRYGDDSAEIDLFYTEGRGLKELVWAGDGLQVFLQVLLHHFLAEAAETIVLDEPDVYMHPDLQRRTIRLLKAPSRQVVLTTHSPEVVIESPPDAITWVDRSRRRAIRAPDGDVLEDLRKAIGSAGGLDVAHVLRRRAIVFVEGDDVRILRKLGLLVGRGRLDSESNGLGVLKLGGIDNWRRLEGFAWLSNELLEREASSLVILDSDVRSPEEVEQIATSIGGFGMRCRVWKAHELENYLVVPAAIARVSGADISTVEQLAGRACEDLKADTIASGVKYWAISKAPTGRDIKTITAEVLEHVDSRWQSLEGRIHMVGGKELISQLNKALQRDGYDTVTAMSLAANLLPDELDPEVIAVLDEIENL